MKVKQLLKSLTVMAALCMGSAHAQVSVMLPANPGGGWDSTGRQAFQAMNQAGIYTGTVNFSNKGGAGGTIGLSDFQRAQKGKPDALAVFGAITVGAITLNSSPVDLSKFKPVARLTAEYLVLAVKADSPYKTLDDFVASLKSDPGATAVGGGSAGGVDHIALALLAQSAGVPVPKLNYIPQAGGADTVIGIINGTLKAGISGISEFQQFAQEGRIRILGITTAERMKGLDDIPTFKEAGYDVEIANWRGILGSIDMPEANHKEWVERFTKLSESKEWQAVLDKQGWDAYFLPGDAFGEFIQSESSRINQILKDAGLAK
ncbi:tripartite tricarboxylate transporter substrate-binding protein [Pusillimonas sp. SM2304]|uniref:Bug family tripartite tricarboxylate transporter substrate binding protein n=1 Tax=Pusillimonas sp. SM2304 TaxID=3073241 RepID=UPI002876E1E1|nr:tripartite tricarboxylate transporter substrate-binding protein [Pusillimonas sp. SM2304]MDS1139043.1 tripartite tricarboxylate transporter substrate-binding protein [Pusillimonas sp. SM2304]